MEPFNSTFIVWTWSTSHIYCQIAVFNFGTSLSQSFMMCGSTDNPALSIFSPYSLFAFKDSFRKYSDFVYTSIRTITMTHVCFLTRNMANRKLHLNKIKRMKRVYYLIIELNMNYLSK